MPKIDVFCYTYNHSQFVIAALNSIKSQSGVEIGNFLIIDDASSDSTKVLIDNWIIENREWLNKNSGEFEFRFREKDENQGQSKTLKEGLQTSTSEYFAILEGDDVWINDRHLYGLLRELESSHYFSMAFSGWYSMTPTNEFVGVRTSEDATKLSDQIWDFKRLLDFNAPGTLSACLYRGSSLRTALHKILRHEEIADLGVNLIMCQYGPLLFSKQVSLNYRHVTNSAWRKISTSDQQNIFVQRLINYASSMPEQEARYILDFARDYTKNHGYMAKVRYVLRNPRLIRSILRRKLAIGK